MYEILNTAIRSVDNVSLIIFESVTWDNFVFGFTQAPGGEKFADRSVFGYHYYRLPRVTSMDAAMKFQLKKSQNLSCGGMLTEFDTAAGNSEIILSTSTADEHLQSWIGWEYKPLANITGWGFGVVDENGHLNKPLATNLSRPYATAVAGYVTVMKYSDVTNTFKLRYLIDKTTTGPTEIFISRNYHYPNGFNVTVTPAYFANYTEVNDGIEVYHKSEAIHNADLLVEITPV